MTKKSPHVGLRTMGRALAKERGFTLIEVLITVSIISIIASIAVPRLLAARMVAQETSAIASMRNIHSAQASYAATCGRTGYAQSLDDLARPLPGGVAGFMPAPLSANGVLAGGYIATILPAAGAVDVAAGAATCNGAAAPTVTVYIAERHPSIVGVTGNRSFAVNQTGTIYVRMDGATILDVTGETPLR